MVEGNILEDLFGGDSTAAASDKDLFGLNIETSNGEVVIPSLTRSHSVDDLPLDIERGGRHNVSHSPLSRSVSCAPVDLRQISLEMPICLLEEDEENDEEIKRLVSKETIEARSTSTRSSSNETVPNGTKSDRINSSLCQPEKLTFVLPSTAGCNSSTIANLAKKKNKLSRHNLKKQRQSNKVVTAQTRTILRDFLYKQREAIIGQSNSTSNKMSLNGSLNLANLCTLAVSGNSTYPTVSEQTEMISLESFEKPRKKKLLKPHPPLTSYGVFLRENQSEYAGLVTSSQDTARKLGKLWGLLDKTKKQEYSIKSQIDQYRYVRELKEYLWETFEGVPDKESLSLLVDETIESTLQHDNSELTCALCQISFCNMFRKNAHFCGRPHCNELLNQLLRVIPEKSPNSTKNDTSGSTQSDSQSSSCSEEEKESFESLEELVSTYCCQQHHSDCTNGVTETGLDEYQSEDDSLSEDEEVCELGDGSICESVASEVESIVGDVQQLITQVEENISAFNSEKTTCQELVSCHCHLLEREYELEHWSIAYKEAIDSCFGRIQMNRQSLQKLMKLLEKCSRNQ